MNDTKKFYASLGIMGPLSGLIVMALNTFVFKGSFISEADVTELINQLAALWGMLSGMYARWRATKQIA